MQGHTFSHSVLKSGYQLQNIWGMKHFLLLQVKCPCPLDDILMKVFLQLVN